MQSFHYDVVVIGGGIAALSAAITAKEEGASVALISKGKIGFGGSSVISNSVFSSIFSPSDSPEIFYHDILEGSRHLSNKKLARVLAEECTLKVDELRKKYGIHLESEKKIKTPGHSFPRRIYAGGGQGRNTTKAMRTYAREIGIEFHERTTLIDLIRDGTSIVGTIVERNNKLLAYYSSANVLATGGFGGLYCSTDNPRDNFGEGIGIAFRHGVKLVDMEFVQYYPYRMKSPANIDVLTKIFAKGACLVNEVNERFMDKYPRKELETRDILCYEMYKQKNVFLDFTRVLKDDLEHDSPKLYRLYKKGYTDKCVMQPVQHYCMGGIQTDEWGRTNLNGLYACGECAGGLHGANRLAGGSLTEALVFGSRTGQMAVRETGPVYLPGTSKVLRKMEHSDDITEAEEKDVLSRVKDVMWRKVGIERSTDSLEEASREFENIISRLKIIGTIRALQLSDKVRSAWAAAYAGATRKESRGAHKLQNIKEEKKEWELKIILQKNKEPILSHI